MALGILSTLVLRLADLVVNGTPGGFWVSLEFVPFSYNSDSQLRQTLHDTESTLSASDTEFEADWDETFEPNFGPFSGFFLNEEIQESISPFLDITISQEEELLKTLRLVTDSTLDSPFFSPPYGLTHSQAFDSLNVRLQRVLKKCRDSCLLHQIDSRVFNFLTSDESQLCFKYFNAQQRQMVHAVAEFYQLISFSVNKANRRDTIVHKPTRSFFLPSIPLISYLANEL
eukprot:TRINITY_DN1773_c0_g1_i11.p1 TRINITY_DN1773_c0_g1~~TRINITY_DN1773_c0_g1_i11.p1  ORF type:complete len:229 (-),score=24.38 TRINITY_DN1773_c0_g1_i11:273-959(-)